MLISLLFLSVFAHCRSNSWYQDEWQSLEAVEQHDLMSVLTSRFETLSENIKNQCQLPGNVPIAVLISLVVVNSTNSEEHYKKFVIWESDEPPCHIKIFDASSKALWKWCKERPDRLLNFSYNYTEHLRTVVHTKCWFFSLKQDVTRLPFPNPFNLRRDQVWGTAFSVLASVFAVLLVTSLLYCHRVPLRNNLTAQWNEYRDRKELKEIREIIETRRRRIAEELANRVVQITSV